MAPRGRARNLAAQVSRSGSRIPRTSSRTFSRGSDRRGAATSSAFRRRGPGRRVPGQTERRLNPGSRSQRPGSRSQRHVRAVSRDGGASASSGSLRGRRLRARGRRRVRGRITRRRPGKPSGGSPVDGPIPAHVAARRSARAAARLARQVADAHALRVRERARSPCLRLAAKFDDASREFGRVELHEVDPGPMISQLRDLYRMIRVGSVLKRRHDRDCTGQRRPILYGDFSSRVAYTSSVPPRGRRYPRDVPSARSAPLRRGARVARLAVGRLA